MIAATSIDAIAFVGMAVALTSDAVSLDWVYLFIFIHGIAHTFFAPAQAAFLANLVSPTILPKAIALNSTMGHLATMVGPFAAGVLITVIDRGGVLVDDRHRPSLPGNVLIIAKHTGAIVRELKNIQGDICGDSLSEG